jgi:hypothetical protein
MKKWTAVSDPDAVDIEVIKPRDTQRSEDYDLRDLAHYIGW